jgi:hypothetical protein
MLDQVREESAIVAEPAPCDTCRHAARCGAEQLACERFAVYAHGASEVRWSIAPRVPDAGIWQRLFAKPGKGEAGSAGCRLTA